MESQLPGIEERLTNLENEIQKLHQKHDGLINYLLKTSSVPNAPPANPTSSSYLKSDPTPPASAAPVASRTQRQFSSAHLLPLVAVICFVFAGVFLIRLAIESGWLTAERQLSLAFLLGGLLTGAGRFLPQVDSDSRSYLSAAGIIVLYICAFSSSLYFQIFSPEVSFSIAAGISALCLTLFHHHKSELFPVITSVGTYLSPLLLGSKQDLVFHAGFFLIWSAVFSTVSTYLRTRTLALTASYFGLGVFAWLHAQTTDPQQLSVIILVQILQFMSFAYGTYNYTIKNQDPLSEKMSMAYLPALLFFYGTTYYFLNRLSPGKAPFISLAFAAFLYLLYKRARNQVQKLNSEGLVHGFLAVVFFHSGYLQILPSASKPWLLPTILLLSYIAERKDLYPKISRYFKAAFGLIGAIEFGSICLQLLTTNRTETVVPALTSLFLGLFVYLRGFKMLQDKSYLFLGGLHIISILSLYRLMFDYGSFAVSAGWGVYSLIILGLGYWKKDMALAKSSLIVLLATSLKALVYDASQSASGVRILSLLLTGVVLYAAGLMLKKINNWRIK